MDLLKQTLRGLKVCIPETLGKKQLRLELSKRTCGMPQEMTKFAVAAVPLPLGGIARNGNRCAADLVGETVNLTLRETVGQLVSFRDQIHGLLPRDQILEML